MIVQPDFPDHWKTRLLVDLTGDPTSPLCVIRFWAHCQNRRTCRFENMDPHILKSICGFQGDAIKFYSAMIQTFCKVENGVLIAHGWEEINAKLVSNWKNGGEGGRPKQQSKKTQRKPNGNPNSNSDSIGLTHQEPIREDKIRVEKNRIDKKRGSVEELIEFCKSLGLPASDGESLFLKWKENGWTNNGKPIKDWRLVVQRWKKEGWLPSQRQQQTLNGNNESRIPPTAWSSLPDVPGDDEDPIKPVEVEPEW